jgi:hypothetical protein
MKKNSFFYGGLFFFCVDCFVFLFGFVTNVAFVSWTLGTLFVSRYLGTMFCKYGVGKVINKQFFLKKEEEEEEEVGDML